ncbi:MAG: hypothetical protein FWJ92_12590 [Actinomycetes bacterium]|mgnify:CR=1 FL=1|nr:hypothetical protein [Acidimicrobiia bacterium]
MTEADIVAALDRAEAALDEGKSLRGTGFWKAVEEVKRRPELASRLGPRIAAIDQRAFRNWALWTVPFESGLAAAGAITLAGVALIARSTRARRPWNWMLFWMGTVVLLGSTHTLGHVAVGRAFGMRFTDWYIGSITRPQPGVKVDYATYLVTPARQRAWMHAAGAIVTKLVPFALVPIARAASLPRWSRVALWLLGLGQIVTDVLWSVDASDWKKFRREMRHA